jgi:GLPGLI family protein
MKKRMNYTLIALLCATGVNAQTVRVLYEDNSGPLVSQQTTGGDNRVIPSSVVVTQTGADGRAIKGKPTSLIHHAGQSLYAPYQTQEEAEARRGTPATRLNNSVVIYKNTRENQVITEEGFLGESFLVTDKLKEFGWTTSEESKKIEGFTCKKATDATGKITAWFCPDIAINDGPGIYRGLPGLILQVERPGQTIVATDVDTDYPLTQKITPPTTGRKVNPDDLEAEKRKALEKLRSSRTTKSIETRVNR